MAMQRNRAFTQLLSLALFVGLLKSLPVSGCMCLAQAVYVLSQPLSLFVTAAATLCATGDVRGLCFWAVQDATHAPLPRHKPFISFWWCSGSYVSVSPGLIWGCGLTNSQSLPGTQRVSSVEKKEREKLNSDLQYKWQQSQWSSRRQICNKNIR